MELKKLLEGGGKGRFKKTLLRFEKNPDRKSLDIDMATNIVSMVHPENNRKQDFQFDHVFDEAGQHEVFESLGRPVVNNLLEGFNAAVFMYGQTGSGKTYTMFGKEMMKNEGDGLVHEEASIGLVPRCIFRLMDLLHQREAEGMYSSWKLEVTFLEVYRKKLANLLNPSKHQVPKLVILDKEVRVANLIPATPRTAQDLLKLVSIAASRRTVSAHNMNSSSSRSHMIMEIMLQTKSETQETKGKLVFADLAGSERVRKAKTKGKGLKEAQAINSQLMHLREAIKNLSHRKPVQWRDSMLTSIMQPVLSGQNCLTSVIVCASKRPSNRLQTWDTLTFAQNAKKIEVSAMKNRKLPREELNRMIEQLTMEKADLEKKLQSRAMEAAVANKDAELEAALKRIAQLEREIELIQSNVQRLTIDGAQKDKLNKELQYRNGELQERIRDLEGQVENVTHMEMAMQEMEGELGMLNEEKDELMHQNEALQREINQSKELRDALSEMTERFASSAKQKSVDNDKAFSMLSTIDKLAATQDQLQESVREANKKYDNERSEREKLALELERIRAKLEERDEQVESMQRELTKKDNQFLEIESQITEFKNAKEMADARIEALTRESRELKQQKEKAHRRAMTLAQDNQIKMNDLMLRDDQLEEIRQERERLKEQLQSERQKNRDELLAKQMELEKLELEAEKKSNEQAELQEQIQNLDEVRRRLIARNESMEIRSDEEKKKLLQNLEEITNNLKAKEKDLENTKDLLNETQNEHDKKDRELESLWLAHRKLDEEKGLLLVEKNKKEEEVLNLKEHLSQTKTQLEQTGAQLQDLQEEISEKAEALSSLETEKEKEKHKLEEMELMLTAMQQRQDIMREQEKQLEASSAEAQELRSKLAAAQEELNVKSTEVASLKEHLAAHDEETDRLNNDLFTLQSKQVEVESQQSEMERLRDATEKLGNVQDELDLKRVRVAELGSGIEHDKRQVMELSARVEELEGMEGKNDTAEKELAEARARMEALQFQLEEAEQEQAQHVIDLDRLEKTERELQEARNLLRKKQEQLRDAWRKGDQFHDMAILQRNFLVKADHEVAKALQAKFNQEEKRRSEHRIRMSDSRYNNRSPRQKRRIQSHAPGMGPMGGNYLPPSPHGNPPRPNIPEGVVLQPGERPSAVHMPASVHQRPPRQHNIGNYKYTNEIRLGEQVRLSRPRQRLKGVVKWILETPNGYQLGILLEKPVGDSDGSKNGKRYFECEPNYGQFCNSSWISHVLRPNEKTGVMEKIRFENNRSEQQMQRKKSNHMRPEISQYQRTRLRRILKENDELSKTVSRAYRSADTNMDGNIQKEEFRELCQRLNLEAALRNPGFIDQLWQILDVNGDNKMDEEEFSRFISDFMINEISSDVFKILQVKNFDEIADERLLADCLELCLQKRFDMQYAE